MPSEEERDESLVALAARGDRGAFTALVERYGAQVLGVIQREVADAHTALDLAQDAWLKAFRGLPGFRPDAAFRPWLFSIVFNCIRDDHRSRGLRSGRFRTDESQHLDRAAAPARSDPSGRVEETATIDAALDLVPQPFRAAVYLVDVLGLDYEEAAASLECAAGTVKSRVHRGRMAFREHYERLSGDTRVAEPRAATEAASGVPTSPHRRSL